MDCRTARYMLYEKYGKATNLMVNYAIIAEGME